MDELSDTNKRKSSVGGGLNPVLQGSNPAGTSIPPGAPSPGIPLLSEAGLWHPHIILYFILYKVTIDINPSSS